MASDHGLYLTTAARTHHLPSSPSPAPYPYPCPTSPSALASVRLGHKPRSVGPAQDTQPGLVGAASWAGGACCICCCICCCWRPDHSRCVGRGCACACACACACICSQRSGAKAQTQSSRGKGRSCGGGRGASGTGTSECAHVALLTIHFRVFVEAAGSIGNICLFWTCYYCVNLFVKSINLTSDHPKFFTGRASCITSKRQSVVVRRVILA